MRVKAKTIKKILLISVLSVLSAEAVLRFLFGFGTIPVFIEDPDFEYIFAPDQRVNRLGHHFYTNHYSMRSDALSINDSIRILFFGDSILNGGLPTDNNDLATSILEKTLSRDLKRKVRALNISASSWGPDNAAAYLKKHGTFGAKMIVLVFSSHDYFDNMGFEKEVGVNSSYPDKNPCCAISDFIFGYLIPFIQFQIFPAGFNRNDAMYYLNSKQMNTGWQSFIDYAKTNHIPLIVYLHAEKQEAMQGHYNQYGIWLGEYLESLNIQCIHEVNLNPDQQFYRDFIHFNQAGQQFMAKALEPVIIKSLISKEIY